MAECILVKSGGGTGSDDCTAARANVLAGVTAVTKDSGDEAVAGTMANKGAWTSRIGVNGKAVIPAGYHNGSGYVDQAITNRGAVNASLGINGTYAIPEGYHNGSGKVTQNIATMGAQTVTPGNAQKVVSCSGKYMTGNITVPAVSNLAAQYIKKGVTVGGIVGTWEGYVAAPTDIYKYGVNASNLKWGNNAFGNCKFESNMITCSGNLSDNVGLISQVRYNFTPYTHLNIEFDVAATSGTLRIRRSATGDMTPSDVMGEISFTCEKGKRTTVSIPLAVHNFTGFLVVSRFSSSVHHIYRIWLS